MNRAALAASILMVILVSSILTVPFYAYADPDHKQKGKPAFAQAGGKEKVKISADKSKISTVSSQTVAIKAKGIAVEKPGMWSTASDVTVDLKGSVQKREGNHSDVVLGGTLDIGGNHYQIGAKGKLKIDGKNKSVQIDGKTQDGVLKIHGIVVSVEDGGKTLKFVTGPVAKFGGHLRIYGLTGEVRLTDSASSPAGQFKLTVKSADMEGKPISGMFVNLDRGGKSVATGYTPFSFSLKSGAQYTVSVSDYQNKVFDHWENGSTDRSRTVTLGADADMTAYYKTSGSSGLALTVNAVGPDGAERHMWTTIQSGSTILQSGYTPLIYQGLSGTYTVSISDYQDLVFDHWENGSASRTRTVTLSSATTLTAHFKQSAQSSGLDHFAITTIGDQTVGNTFTFQVTALDGLGRIKTGFDGTVTFSTDDGASPSGNVPVVPAAYTFTSADAGQHVFSAKMYNARSGVTITVAGEGETATSSAFSVLPAAVATVTLSPPSATISSDETASFTAQAKDAYGNRITGTTYVWELGMPSLGWLSLSSNTAQATLIVSNVSAKVTTTLTAITVYGGSLAAGSASVTVDPE